MIELLFSNPGFIIILAGLFCAVLPVSQVRKVLVTMSPIAAAYLIFIAFMDVETARTVVSVGEQEMVLMRIDRLAMIWGYVFCLAGVLNAIYGFHEKCKITDSSALIYMGAAVSGVFAGDFITLFIFWELAAVSSVMLVWKGGENAYASGVRYLAIHVLSGVLLLAGAIIFARSRGWDFTIDNVGLQNPGGLLLMIAMGIKCGFPLLHNWIQDAYPKASITGTVILSAFTTKLALYALARCFAGEDILIYIGAIMTCFPVFFAVIENDLRRVLSYSLNNQLGFMVCGIGLADAASKYGALAMNGVAAHLAADVIFKGLLFMSMGAVVLRTGTAKASDLGGLFRSMPYTTIFCLIGAGSISAFPLLSAFVTKSMIITAALDTALYDGGIGLWVVFGMLLFASAGVMEHSGIKVPYFTFFAHDSGKRVEEAPWNMLLAMGLASFICILFAFPFWGIGYELLYSLLPHQDVNYQPYTGNHVVTQLQLLFAAILAFNVLKKLQIYPDERRAEILDFDWTYRRLGKSIVLWIDAMWTRLSANVAVLRQQFFMKSGRRLYQMFSPAGTFSQAAPSGIATLLTGAMLVLLFGVIYLVEL